MTLLAVAAGELAPGARPSRPSGTSRSAFSLGRVGFSLPLLEWINDGLLTFFFLVVGLEIKREFTVGHLSNRRAAALPVAAAVGGMVVPGAALPADRAAGTLAAGWGVPMATDTAFAVALIAVLGSRVPVELRIFLTAAVIVDDIVAIVIVALFYSGAHRTRATGAGAVAVASHSWRSTAAASTVPALCAARRRCSGALLHAAGCTRPWPASSWRS